MGLEEEDQEIKEEPEIKEPETEEPETEEPEIEELEIEEPEAEEPEIEKPEIEEPEAEEPETEEPETEETESTEDNSEIIEISPIDTPESLQPEETLSNNELMEQELLEFADFESLDELSEDDLADMMEAIEENKDQAIDGQEIIEQEKPEFKPEIDEELEAKMQAELELKKKSRGIKETTREDLIEYLSERRAKIVYHALWHLIFNVGDEYIMSKQMLYEALKEVTSKNPVEPLEEHKFYFGLGFILRLKLGIEKIIKFKAGKLQIAINPKVLQEILLLIGDPISERPILTTREKNKMFEDFLGDDFLDI